MEFDEVRLYQPGDDIRSMDWRVTARTGKPHSKLFREERERPALVLVDLRPAMFFATRGALKAIVAAECASLLAWSVMQQGDRIGSLIFSGEHSDAGSTALLKPARGRRGVLRMLGSVVNHPHWQQRSAAVNESQSLQHMLQRASHAAHSGSLIMLISDGRGLNEDTVGLLKRLLMHHTLVFVLIYDVFEAQLPNAGLLQASDGRRHCSLDSSDARAREQHQAHFLTRRQHLQDLARLPGFVFLQCATDEDPFTVLQKSMGR